MFAESPECRPRSVKRLARYWEACFAPLIAAQLRMKRRGHVGVCWHVDETYVKVQGKWCYLYRAIYYPTFISTAFQERSASPDTPSSS
jgi:hypothetical protein